MSLPAGLRLGPYEIVTAIGKGGMGEVFRAKDTRLERDVAIKDLPATFAQDRERLARVEREARVLASLNHTNIAHVYGFESATLPDGSVAHFLAMELVDGERQGQGSRLWSREGDGPGSVEPECLALPHPDGPRDAGLVFLRPRRASQKPINPTKISKLLKGI